MKSFEIILSKLFIQNWKIFNSLFIKRTEWYLVKSRNLNNLYSSYFQQKNIVHSNDLLKYTCCSLSDYETQVCYYSYNLEKLNEIFFIVIFESQNEYTHNISIVWRHNNKPEISSGTFLFFWNSRFFKIISIYRCHEKLLTLLFFPDINLHTLDLIGTYGSSWIYFMKIPHIINS